MKKFKLLFGESNVKNTMNILGTLMIATGICILPIDISYRTILLGAFVVLLSYSYTTN